MSSLAYAMTLIFPILAASALLVVSVLLPNPKPSEPRGIYDRTTRGIRIYLATPRLRGLLALNLAAAAAGAAAATGFLDPLPAVEYKDLKRYNLARPLCEICYKKWPSSHAVC